MIKIGATDCGEPYFNLSWVDKLNEVDGAVIISKGIGHGDHDFKNALLDHSEKVIFHCTLTGLGGTNVEPGVPAYNKTLNYLEALIGLGFPSSHVVIRIDPIIGSKLFSQVRADGNPVRNWIRNLEGYKGLVTHLINMCRDYGVTRFRYSFLDLYPHVRRRFESLGFVVPEWAMSFDEMNSWNELFLSLADEGRLSIETCAEKNTPKQFQIGCVSKRDFEILGLNPDDCIGKCYQRKTCLCSGNKVELLNSRKPCSHGCLYCFWKG